MYKATRWFSTFQIAFYTFQLKIFPRAFQAVNNTTPKILNAPLIILLGRDISEKRMNEKNEWTERDYIC